VATRPWWIAALLWLYPRDYRAHAGADLACAMETCARRERASGTGAMRLAVRLTVDAVHAAMLVRRDARRRQPRLNAPSPGDSAMQSIMYDVRHALRAAWRAPLFSAIVIATLALAIGANTAIFTVVDGVLLRSLPYTQPDRLVLLYESVSAAPHPFGFSAPDFTAFRERTRSYESLAAYRSAEYELSGVDQPVRINAARVTAALFDVLDVAPAIGRPFTTEEDTGRQPVAILSNPLWRGSFGADPAIVGRAIVLDRRPYTIVGVMPPRFVFPNRGPAINGVPAEVYLPMAYTDMELRAFGSMYNNSVIGRLKPDVSPAQAASEGSAITTRLVAEIYPAQLRELGWSLTTVVTPLRDELVGNVERILFVLLAAVLVVLLIACADIACLMLTRAASREREMAIRVALGAGRWRVMRLMIIEAAVLSLAGGIGGFALAWWGAHALVAAAPIDIPRASEIAVDWRVLGFTLVTSSVAALCCGLLPAWEASRRNSGVTLKEGGRAVSSSARQRRIFAALVTAQFACAVVLLASGGLLTRSLVRLVGTDPGFAGNNVISVAISLPAAGYPGEATSAIYTDGSSTPSHACRA
jgi:putative ABC transport system permease protein